ncbi:MAG: hypothetical protein EXR36_05845 [Betaproteobacteria bacterium]|nr:hypothetical protein [Betaproteobacteria bacterium]
MSARQFLILWLSQVAGRLRMIRGIHAGASVTFWLLGILVLYQVLRGVIPYPEVQALLPLLVIAAVAATGYGAMRMIRTASLSEAAGVADQKANLRDQLKSAYWFAQLPCVQPAVELLVQRASRAARERHPREILPLQVPKSAWGSLGLMLVVAILAAWPPQWARSVKMPESSAVAARNASKPTNLAPATGPAAGGMTSQGTSPTRATTPESAGSVHNEEASDEDKDSKGAADDGQRDDAPRQAAAGETAAGAGGTPGTRSVQNSQRESPTEWLGSVISRLKEMIAQDDGKGEDFAPEGSAQGVARAARADNGRNADTGSANPSPEYRKAERSENSNMALNSLGGMGPRNTVAGEADNEAGEEQSGRNNSNAGPLGQRVGTSRAGAGDEGDAPRGDPGGNAEAAPVLGNKTQRLAMQLRRVTAQSKSSSEARDEEEGTPEAFFSATRSQAARAEMREVEGTVSAVRAEAAHTEETPLAYRAVVKDYFLTQHRKEK